MVIKRIIDLVHASDHRIPIGMTKLIANTDAHEYHTFTDKMATLTMNTLKSPCQRKYLALERMEL